MKSQSLLRRFVTHRNSHNFTQFQEQGIALGRSPWRLELHDDSKMTRTLGRRVGALSSRALLLTPLSLTSHLDQCVLITHSFFSHNFSLYTVQRGLSNPDSPAPAPQSGLCLVSANNSHHGRDRSENRAGKVSAVANHSTVFLSYRQNRCKETREHRWQSNIVK